MDFEVNGKKDENETGTRVWWNSNFGNESFYYPVTDLEEVRLIIDVLTKYDLYLGDKIEANAGGVEVLNDDGQWEEYHDDDGRDIMEILEGEEQ